MKKKVALSWSGGKDAAMCLQKLHEKGYEMTCLLTTIPKEIDRTFGHGEKKEAIEAQGKSLGIPVEWIECTFSTYTEDFMKKLMEVKHTYGIEAIAFGDLYLEEHRDWGEKVAEKCELQALYPLWMKESESLQALRNFVESGYKAKVIRVHKDKIGTDWLGREVNEQFYQDIQQKPVCPMGEGGEYHTFVYDGPLFKQPVPFELGEILPLETTYRIDLEIFTYE